MSQDDTTHAAQPEAEEYDRPRYAHLGSAKELTQGGTEGNADGDGFSFTVQPPP